MSNRSLLVAGAAASSFLIANILGFECARAHGADPGWVGANAYFSYTAYASDESRQGLHLGALLLYPGVSIDAIRGVLGPDAERFKADSGNLHYAWNLPDGTRLAGEFDEVGSLLSMAISVYGSSRNPPYSVIGRSVVMPRKHSIRDIQSLFPYGCLEKKQGMENMDFQRFLVQSGPEGTWAYGFIAAIEIGAANGGKDVTRIPIYGIELFTIDRLSTQNQHGGCSFR
jgi:hypothetical protein